MRYRTKFCFFRQPNKILIRIKFKNANIFKIINVYIILVAYLEKLQKYFIIFFFAFCMQLQKLLLNFQKLQIF